MKRAVNCASLLYINSISPLELQLLFMVVIQPLLPFPLDILSPPPPFGGGSKPSSLFPANTNSKSGGGGGADGASFGDQSLQCCYFLLHMHRTVSHSTSSPHSASSAKLQCSSGCYKLVTRMVLDTNPGGRGRLGDWTLRSGLTRGSGERATKQKRTSVLGPYLAAPFVLCVWWFFSCDTRLSHLLLLPHSHKSVGLVLLAPQPSSRVWNTSK